MPWQTITTPGYLPTTHQRLKEFITLLHAEGMLLELRHDNGRLAIYKRTCPFISMFESTRTICDIDMGMLSNVVRSPVCRIASRHDGDLCCAIRGAQRRSPPAVPPV